MRLREPPLTASKNRPYKLGRNVYQSQAVERGMHFPMAVDDIHIVRDGNAYRLLHGQLRLLTALGLLPEIFGEVRGEGRGKVVRTPQGYFGGPDCRRLPVLLS